MKKYTYFILLSLISWQHITSSMLEKTTKSVIVTIPYEFILKIPLYTFNDLAHVISKEDIEKVIGIKTVELYYEGKKLSSSILVNGKEYFPILIPRSPFINIILKYENQK
jgi:hypothetical protein